MSVYPLSLSLALDLQLWGQVTYMYQANLDLSRVFAVLQKPNSEQERA